MNLRFDPVKDAEKYQRVRPKLMAEFSDWREGVVDASLTLDDDWGRDAHLLLDWRMNWSSGDLGAFDLRDFEEFLITWCPQKLSFAPEFWLRVVDGIEAWVRFLEDTGRWAGGRTRPLLAGLQELIPDYVDAMGDPSKFGMAKGMFSNPVFAGVLDSGDPDALEAAVAAFNALPFEERKEYTDQGFDNLSAPDPEPIDLPLTPAPDPGRAAEEAANAPIIVQIDAMREFVGAGLQLTAKGNTKVADTKALLELIPTDDIVDGRFGALRSADQAPHLQYLIDVALDAGALDIDGTRLVAPAEWADIGAVDRVRRLLESCLELGPITSRLRVMFGADRDEFVEQGFVHLLVPAFVEGSASVDAIVEHLNEVADRFHPVRERWMEDFEDDQMARRMERLIDVAVRCGLVVRLDAEEYVDEYIGPHGVRGGMLVVTDLGRLLLAELLPDEGYLPHPADELSGVDAAELIRWVADGEAMGPTEIWEAWSPDISPAEKAAQIVDAILATSFAEERTLGLAVLTAAGADGLAAAEALRGTPLEAYLWMLRQEAGAAPDEVPELDRAVVLVPLVDMLVMHLDDDIDEFAAAFDDLVPASDRLAVLAELWRVDLAETADVLDALGRRHPDKKVAKAARKALMQHRSRYPRR